MVYFQEKSVCVEGADKIDRDQGRPRGEERMG